MRKHALFSLTALTLVLAMLAGLMLIGSAEGSAPVAENFEFETYRGVSFGGQLCAIDPEGDTLSYRITTEPVKGTVELDENGSFTYTPDEGKRGKDYFGYKAIDSEGNSSQEATVIIKLIKQDTDISYEDMKGDPSACSAVKLAESGIFTGKKIGSSYFFEPDETLSRGEFLRLCLEATGADILSGVVTTGFTDDAEIPDWVKCYVSTAVRDGAVHGYSRGGRLVFDSEAEISAAEAAVMLNGCLKLNDVTYVNLDGEVPAWAAQSAANLSSCDVLSADSVTDSVLTRAEAADMLCAAMNVIENR